MPSPHKSDPSADISEGLPRKSALKPTPSPGSTQVAKVARVGEASSAMEVGAGGAVSEAVSGVGAMSAASSLGGLAAGVPDLPGFGEPQILGAGLASAPDNIVLPGFGIQVEPVKNPSDPEEGSIANLIKEMRDLNFNLNSKLESLQMQIALQAVSFKEALTKLRADMVFKTQFVELEVRVQNLECRGLVGLDVSWLQMQVSRLDPANKSLCLKGIATMDVDSRTKMIEECLSKIGVRSNVLNIEHLWKGPPGNRSISAISLIELSSRGSRETAFKKLTEDTSILKNAGLGDEVSCARAKTSLQLKRNSALQKACETLKKDSRCDNKSVEIAWKIDGSKDRGMKVDGQRFSFRIRLK